MSQSELDAVASVWTRAEEPTPANANVQESETTDERYQAEAKSGDVGTEARYSGAAIPVMPPTMPAQQVTRGQAPSDYTAPQTLE